MKKSILTLTRNCRCRVMMQVNLSHPEQKKKTTPPKCKVLYHVGILKQHNILFIISYCIIILSCPLNYRSVCTVFNYLQLSPDTALQTEGGSIVNHMCCVNMKKTHTHAQVIVEITTTQNLSVLYY